MKARASGGATRYTNLELVRTITHPDGSRKVDVIRRANGTFGFAELKWLEEEQAWIPLPSKSNPITDTLDGVLDEIRGRVPWITDDLLKSN